ncbi:beta-1,6-N-acetylglucosaminyltransferase [Rubellimicrobium sp. CFH 75288]|uniref:beta-1,6-N-acetylglucosaminyltransferase n=1 Tax=Rubellimicrobium sp. CFH 75288 TaxID=2697034 RepID=UPI0014121A93|nr:beta-1,6-N-acetylglucosaminyltransferase [Rubellimicrobium sp. CFH 75288]NAZ37326.1 glycosyl transferase [Rubellimicrobium sp. CFH 75288]
MLVHTAFDRAEQVIRFWARGGCPVVVHVDRVVPRRAHDAFVLRLRDLPGVSFSRRHRCEWGTWGIVAATLASCEAMLARHPEVGHVLLASGSCLPLRPVAELRAYLAERPGTDFIESATTADVPWTVGGLSEERFTLHFPFAWRRQRRLFDRWVAIQRRLGLRRAIPDGIVPHMGSQWWCLTRATLAAILTDPDRPRFDRYFRRVWIPDESYFQTLARRHTARIESRSLTLSKFDWQGKPHVFYDDHLPLLRRSDCFVARKIWPHAEGLYQAFLSETGHGLPREPNPSKIDRVFAKAVERRTRGRPGLWMQSRFPREGWGGPPTAGPYSVFEGFAELFEDWEEWLARATGARVHGHLFAPGRVEWEGRGPTFAGALPDNPRWRDHNAQMFLRNLVWNTRGERQCFQFGPRDSQLLSWDFAKDPNAQIAVISGAWIVPLFRDPPPDLRAEAARLQRIESDHLAALRSPHAKARIRIWTLAEFLENPAEALQSALDDMVPARAAATAPRPRLASLPRLADLTGLGAFLQGLKNAGMHPYLMGDLPPDPPQAGGAAPSAAAPPGRRPYLVR